MTFSGRHTTLVGKLAEPTGEVEAGKVSIYRRRCAAGVLLPLADLSSTFSPLP